MVRPRHYYHSSATDDNLLSDFCVDNGYKRVVHMDAFAGYLCTTSVHTLATYY